ncbi:VOC family protein [Sulfitobacter guttiformis]|uniref:Glyoxalase-like protein n=1 Tax=Sulfitobacter guttiformis TaxID=74349 RepID=A0A420DJW1_9RHOB|nr:VOC family protein [Sulfitobacter guttiformis]KIN71633.1 Glyoxalase 3 domain containing protein [Sulfitobacter guttiformis KCTC 32187]RKE94536.1 glyoxalase-like protein [Sulfitobacter guttiformis]
MIVFDHIAVAGETLAAATTHVEAAMGVPLQTGGEHAIFHTHNTLLGLEEHMYLEAIAINPAAPLPDRARWFDLDRFAGKPRLTNWICRCDDLDATLAQLPDSFGAPVDLERGDLRWRMAVPQNGMLPFDNCAPALIQWIGDAHPATRLAQQGCTITTLEVRHPEAPALGALLAPLMADARIMFTTGTPQLTATFRTPNGPATLC